MPLFTYLLQEYHASPNSKKGYLLARAVYARHLPLIRLLLRHGADPALGEGFAMNAAIGQGDLGLVKLLMEREVEREGEEEEEQVVEEEEEEGENDLGEKKKRRRRSSTGGGGKRRKVGDESGDRVTATRKMLEVAIKGKHRAIQEYLQGKGEWPLGRRWDARTVRADPFTRMQVPRQQ